MRKKPLSIIFLIFILLNKANTRASFPNLFGSMGPLIPEGSVVVEQKGPGFASVEIITNKVGRISDKNNDNASLPIGIMGKTVLKNKNLKGPLPLSKDSSDFPLTTTDNNFDELTSFGKAFTEFLEAGLNEIINYLNVENFYQDYLNETAKLDFTTSSKLKEKTPEVTELEKKLKENENKNKPEGTATNKEKTESKSEKLEDSNNINVSQTKQTERVLTKEDKKKEIFNKYFKVKKNERSKRSDIYIKIGIVIFIFYFLILTYLVFLHFREKKKLENYKSYNRTKYSIEGINLDEEFNRTKGDKLK